MSETFEISGVPDAIGTYVRDLPDALEGAVGVGGLWQGKPGTLLLRVPHVATYRVRGGETIEVARAAQADHEAVELFLYGAARAALLHQRGELPLHASTLVPPGRHQALALCGDSGAGKSTLSVELSRRGWTLLADDTTRIQWADGLALAWPSGRGVKLWQDTCDHFQIDSTSLRRVRKSMSKFYLALPASPKPVPLAVVLELSRTRGGLCRLHASGDRMSLLTRHAFRPQQIAALGVQAQHIQVVARVAGSCSLGVVPGCRIEPVDVLADKVEEAAAWIKN